MQRRNDGGAQAISVTSAASCSKYLTFLTTPRREVRRQKSPSDGQMPVHFVFRTPA